MSTQPLPHSWTHACCRETEWWLPIVLKHQSDWCLSLYSDLSSAPGNLLFKSQMISSEAEAWTLNLQQFNNHPVIQTLYCHVWSLVLILASSYLTPLPFRCSSCSVTVTFTGWHRKRRLSTLNDSLSTSTNFVKNGIMWVSSLIHFNYFF